LAVPLLGAFPGFSIAGKLETPTANPLLVRGSRTLLGTRVDVAIALQQASEERLARQGMQLAFSEMARLESLMTRFRSDSDVAKIGLAAGKAPVPVAPEVMSVLRAAQQIHQLSAGAFDPLVGSLTGWNFEPGKQMAPLAAQLADELPNVDMNALSLDEKRGTAYLARPGMRLDLGGVAKLPILEAGLDILALSGLKHALINGGGDVLVRGQLHGRPWRVGVRNPQSPAHLLQVLEVEGAKVVASSGDYERTFTRGGRTFHHILNPRTGWPTEGVRGVTLVSHSVQEVNGLGASMMVRGPAWARETCARTGLKALLASADGSIWRSPGFAAA